MKIQLGDIFVIETQTRQCILQYCHFSEGNGYLVRVFIRPKSSSFNELETVVQNEEDFSVFLFLKHGLKNSSIIKIGNQDIPATYEVPRYMRAESVFDKSRFKWRIVPMDPGIAQTPVEELTDEQAKLSPYQIWSSEGLIEQIDSGFTLNTWR